MGYLVLLTDLPKHNIDNRGISLKISPYLESLLKKWGSNTRRIKPWHTECVYLKEYSGQTSREPVISTETDEVELIGIAIGNMAQPLRRSLEAMHKHRFRTDACRAKWCRCSKKDFKASYWIAIAKLEYFVAEEMTVNN
jgi:hypothetical protein